MLWLLKNTISSTNAHSNNKKKKKKKKSDKNKVDKKFENKTCKKKHPLSENPLAGEIPDIDNASSKTDWPGQLSADPENSANNRSASRAFTAWGPTLLQQQSSSGACGVSLGSPTEGYHHIVPEEGRSPSRAATTRIQGTAHLPPPHESSHGAQGTSEAWPSAEHQQHASEQVTVQAVTPALDFAGSEHQHANGRGGWNAVGPPPRKSSQTQRASDNVSSCPPVYSTVGSTDSSTFTSTSEKLAWLVDQTALPAVAVAEDEGSSRGDGLRQQPIIYGPDVSVQDWSGFIDTRQQRDSAHILESVHLPDPRHIGPLHHLTASSASTQSRPSPLHHYERGAPFAPFKFGISIETILLLRDRVSDTLLQLWEVSQSESENIISPLIRTVEVATSFRHASKTLSPSRHGKISSSRMLVQGLDDRIPPNDPRRFRAWELNYECSIGFDRDRRFGGLGEFGAGFVSPVVDIDERGTWHYDIENFFDVLTRQYRLVPTATCGTHYSVLPFGGWSLVTLQSLARAIVHFEEVTTPH